MARLGAALTGFLLFLLWGSIVTGTAMLGLFAVAAAIWKSAGFDLMSFDVILMRVMLQGVALGIGFTAAFAQRRSLTLERLFALARRPVLAIALLLGSFGGYAAWDFLRCDIFLFMPDYWFTAEMVGRRTRAAADRRKLHGEELRDWLAAEVDGYEWREQGWRFRLSTPTVRTVALPDGPWFEIDVVDPFPNYRGVDVDLFPVRVIAKPESIGAWLSALQVPDDRRVE